MPKCTVCSHPRRSLIDLALVARTPMQAIGRRFDLKIDALSRHRKNHLPPQTRAQLLVGLKPQAIDLEQLERSESEGLLGELITQRQRLHALASMAAELDNVRGSIAAERAITQNLQLVSALLGMLVTRHEVKRATLLVSADYLTMRSTIIDALKPFPEASRAVSAALAKIEVAAAEEIANGPPLLLEAPA